MLLPKDSQIASYLLTAKVNYLAHLGVGKRQKASLITLPLVFLVLSLIAGSVVLAGESKVAAYLSLAASVITGGVLYLGAFTNWRGHLQVGSGYEALYQETLGYDMRNEIDENRLTRIGKEFRDLTLEASRLEVQLGSRQIERYKERARNDLPESVNNANPQLLD
jgi:hypothetical protein